MAATLVPPFRVALLGVDEQTTEIARAAIANRQFDLVGLYDEETAGAGAHRTLPDALARVRRFSVWEAVLDSGIADVVVVARSNDQDLRSEQLRKLIQTEMPVLAVHPIVDSMLVYYELDMIRRDTGSLIVPYLPERNHPAIRALGEAVSHGEESPLGKVTQVALQRRVVQTDAGHVVGQFARDVDLIRAITGELTRLGAIAGAAGETSEDYAGLSVQMSGPSGVIGRWTVDPASATLGGQLTILGTRGKAIVDMPTGDQPWTMERVVDGQSSRESFDEWDPARAALDWLAAALTGDSPSPDWVDAARDLELAETIERSLAKSRTIELYYEDYTEQGTFKGTMTSVGCGLLLFGLCMLGLVGIGDHLRIPFLDKWPYVLAGGLVLFLLLQMLMLVFHRDGARDCRERYGGHGLATL
mgnify:FL=1